MQYRKWTYCVQYRETDFNFVSRLLEHEGIYYYVRHTDGHNTLVLTDSTSKHTASPGYEEIPFVAPGQRVRPELEHIQSWDLTREIQPGVYVHDDYDLERPSVELKTKKTLSRGYTPSDYEVFDYPGEYVQKPDGEQYAGVRIDEYGSQFEVTHATTNSKGVRVGALFTLQDFPRDDQNREHLVIAASYDLQYAGYEGLPQGGGTHYRCTFTAMSSAQQFRPRRVTPKPFVQGPQTAVVTGPSGDEIHTDKYGRVKVQFHWDRYGKKNENSSCWIRVSHPWAGKNWGIGGNPAHRAGGDRRVPRGRSRPADHHRPRVQRGADAAVRASRQQDADRREDALEPERDPRRTSTRSASRTRRARSSCTSTPRRTRTSRSRPTRRTRSATTARRRSATTRRPTWGTTGPRRSGADETITIGAATGRRAWAANETITIDGQPHEDGGRERDDQHRREPQRRPWRRRTRRSRSASQPDRHGERVARASR